METAIVSNLLNYKIPIAFSYWIKW